MCECVERCISWCLKTGWCTLCCCLMTYVYAQVVVSGLLVTSLSVALINNVVERRYDLLLLCTAFLGVITILCGVGALYGSVMRKETLLKAILIAQIGVLLVNTGLALLAPRISSDVYEQLMYEVQYEYGTDNDSDSTVTKRWDTIMTEKGCCGVNNYMDWNGSDYHTITDMLVPPACCKVMDNSNLTLCLNEASYEYNINLTFTYLNPQGCYQQITSSASITRALLIASIVAMVLDEITLAVYSMGLRLADKRQKAKQQTKVETEAQPVEPHERHYCQCCCVSQIQPEQEDEVAVTTTCTTNGLYNGGKECWVDEMYILLEIYRPPPAPHQYFLSNKTYKTHPLPQLDVSMEIPQQSDHTTVRIIDLS